MKIKNRFFRIFYYKVLLKNIAVFFLMITSILSFGCGTTVTHGDSIFNESSSSGGHPVCIPYSGVILDSFVAVSEFPVGTIALIDVPFSFVGDTLYLPFDLYQGGKTIYFVSRNVIKKKKRKREEKEDKGQRNFNVTKQGKLSLPQETKKKSFSTPSKSSVFVSPKNLSVLRLQKSVYFYTNSCGEISKCAIFMDDEFLNSTNRIKINEGSRKKILDSRYKSLRDVK